MLDKNSKKPENKVDCLFVDRHTRTGGQINNTREGFVVAFCTVGQLHHKQAFHFFQPLKVCLQTEILGNLFKYILFCFILLFTSSSP